MELIQKALLFAESAHFGQKYGSYPYMYHLLQCKEVGEKYELPEDLIVALILHDVLEDTPVSFHDIECEFGTYVAEIVYAVTDELGRNRKERKEKTYPKIRGNANAIIVKLIDRYCNIKSSISTNRKMFDCYKKEMTEFFDGIGLSFRYGGDAVLDYLIRDIEKLFV